MQEQDVIKAALIAVRQAAQTLCDRATLLLLLEAHGGATRYADFSQQTRLASRLLSSRLARMARDGLLVRMPYSRRPLRNSYHLTHMGSALYEVLALLATWEQAWFASPKVETGVQLLHLDCAAADGLTEAFTTALAVCAACNKPVMSHEVRLHVSAKEMARMPRKNTCTRRASESIRPNGGISVTPMPHAIAVLGDKWSIEVMVAAFFRAQQFGEFVALLGISSNILTDRLKRLVALGMLNRQSVGSAARRSAYQLTPKGRDFYAVLIAIQTWADNWIDNRVLSPVKLQHMPCSNVLKLNLRCAACAQVLALGNTRLRLTT